MRKIYQLAVLLSLCLFMASPADAQRKKRKKKGMEPVVAVMDTVKKDAPKKKDKDKKGPKEYAEFVDSTVVSKEGLFTVHKKDDKVYFEISDDMLDTELMAITRFSKTTAGGSIYGGEEVNRQVVVWEKGTKDKLFLRSRTYVVMSPDSTKPIAKAVENSNSHPIIAALDIKAFKKDSVSGFMTYIVEVDGLFSGDNQAFSLDPIAKQRNNLTSLKSDRSYVDTVLTFPLNTEIKTVKTFGVTTPSARRSPTPQVGRYLPAGRDAGVVTMEFNTSLIMLPKVPMRKRHFDARVGFFANQYEVFGEESQKADTDVFAVRWRLEPKNAADARRQANGELIEPKKPIVYYVDPATPDKWKKYIKMGVDDWAVAFENAGWKNAIRGEYWPENDSTMSLEDARYSVVRYFASPIPNAYGPNVHDPRTGEILESHVGWYHNVMKLLRNWYMIQAAAVDERARDIEFDDELMGELIRFVSSHEIGHTIGLRHNMGASSATPVEKLRDPEWIKENGHTSSIMDYARFNYVAQPGDGVTDLYPRIGDYDKWAIKWGYSYFKDAKDATEEKEILNEMTKEAYKNPRKHFGTEISPYDPRYQTEDIGDNAMIASSYGIENLKRITPNLSKWSARDGESYKDLNELYGNVVGQYRRYMGHVTKYVGGIYDSPKTYDMEGNQFEVVPTNLQRDAVAFLNEQLFTTPEWMLNQDILNKINIESGVEQLKALQSRTLGSLMDGSRLARLQESQALNSDNYGINDLVTDLENGIMSEAKARKAVDMHRRNLQKVFVGALIGALEPGKTALVTVPVGATYGYSSKSVDLMSTDLPSIARGHLTQLRRQLLSASARVSDTMSKYHYQDLAKRIEMALDPK